MLQNKGFHRLHARVFWSYATICGKTEAKFCTTHSNICILVAPRRFSGDFHSKIARQKQVYIIKDHLPQHKRCRPNAEVDLIYEVHMSFGRERPRKDNKRFN